MKRVLSCLVFIFIGIACFYFAFQHDVSATLGTTLTIVGVIFVGVGIYKSWRCGIFKDVVDILFHL